MYIKFGVFAIITQNVEIEVVKGGLGSRKGIGNITIR